MNNLRFSQENETSPGINSSLNNDGFRMPTTDTNRDRPLSTGSPAKVRFSAPRQCRRSNGNSSAKVYMQVLQSEETEQGNIVASSGGTQLKER